MQRDSRIIWTNAAYSRIMGYEHGELIGRYPLLFALPDRLAIPEDEALSFRFDEEDERFGKLTQVENIRKDGKEFIHEFSHASMRVGGEALFLLAGRDITERVAREQALIAAQDKLERQSRTDALTGLSNRAHMQSELDALVAKRRPFAVLHVDVNRMKQVNDTFGHLAGDAVLLHVARAFKSLAEEDWVCARIGGDEFVVLMSTVSSIEVANTFATDLVELALHPFDWRATQLHAELSVGISVWDESVETADDLINRSDVALYEAKGRPDCPVVCYDGELARKYASAQALERDIVRAMRARQFTFDLQPIFNIDTRKVEKFEMLVRWHHPERGAMAPDQFLSVLVQLGLSAELDMHVIHCAETVLQQLDDADLPDVGLSINLSATAFSSPNTADHLLWMVECGRVDPARLSLEILESTALTLASDTLEVRLLTRLREAGFQIFLDDFGMGYAGLAHLASLPCTGLKIDRGLSSLVDMKDTSCAIVQALVKLSRELGLEVVIEGVENTTQMAIIHRAGCSVFQGYAIARPMALHDALSWATLDMSEATGTRG